MDKKKFIQPIFLDAKGLNNVAYFSRKEHIRIIYI